LPTIRGSVIRFDPGGWCENVLTGEDVEDNDVRRDAIGNDSFNDRPGCA
jgi:hypothetical protein